MKKARTRFKSIGFKDLYSYAEAIREFEKYPHKYTIKPADYGQYVGKVVQGKYEGAPLLHLYCLHINHKLKFDLSRSRE